MSTIPFDDPNEKIFRAIKHKDLYWDSNGNITSSVFDLKPNEKGLSFDRAHHRSDQDCCLLMHTRLSGKIISLRVEQCFNIEKIALHHTPSILNFYHSEIQYLTVNRNELKQIKHRLTQIAVNEPF